ncbi:MAG: DMT family transporter [Parvibaculaceae bacterium]
MENRTGLAIGLALCAASLYGLIPALARAAFEQGVPAVENTLFRTTVVALILGAACIATGQRLSLPRASHPAFIAQVIGTLLISVCFIASIQSIDVGLAVIIFFTCPIIILLAAPLIERRHPGTIRLAIAGFAFAGLVVAIGPGFDRLNPLGLLLAAAGAIGYAVQFFSGRMLSRYAPPLVLGSLVHAAAWPVTLLVALTYSGGRLAILDVQTVTQTGYACMAGVALVHMIAYVTHMRALKAAPASTVAPYFNAEPVMATATAAIFLGERPELHQYAGGAMVLAALLAASRLRG